MADELSHSGEEKFSDDPEENLQLENQFLKMKLMAETGATFMEGDGELPAEIMNQWLKNIAAFEDHHNKTDDKPLRVLLGNPEFPASDGLDDRAFTQEYLKLTELLGQFHIDVGFGRERDDRFKYDFITKELFDHETTLYPGMITGFLYEEFHPDHEMLLMEKAQEFLNAYFDRTIMEMPFLFADAFIMPDGHYMSREELLNDLRTLHDSVPAFENVSYEMEGTDFTLRKGEGGEAEIQTGEGYCEGRVRYGMVMNTGERKTIEGPYKIYFHLDDDYWSIFFFYLAGYNLFLK